MKRLLLFKKPVGWIVGGVKFSNMRAFGTRDDNFFVQPALSLVDLAAYLNTQGWVATATPTTMTVNGATETLAFLKACDFSTITPNSLRVDLCEGMKLQGFCSGTCP